METKLNWYLVSGEVIYVEKDEENVPQQSIRVNGIIKANEDNIPVSGLAKAQEVLQINFMKLTQNAYPIKGVIIYAISHLGKMTEEEFNNVKKK